MSKILSKTFLWMFVGLLVTFLTGYVISINPNMVEAVFESHIWWISIIVELVLVIYFSTRIAKMKPLSAKISFLLFSFVSGLTFSSTFIAFKLSSIMYVFLITALVFGIFGLIGYFTKIDITKLGTFLLMALLAIIICAIVNIFLQNETFDLILSIICILVFLAYTAYDINQVKRLYESGVNEEIVAVHGAFELYLDFFNIFVNLLSILGDNN